MIAGKSRFDRESARVATDLDVRRELGALSLQCLLMQRRLRLLAQIVQHGTAQMIGLLSTTRRDGSKLSWVRSIVADLQVL